MLLTLAGQSKQWFEAEAGMKEAEEGTYLTFLCGHVNMLVGIQYPALIAFCFSH